MLLTGRVRKVFLFIIIKIKQNLPLKACVNLTSLVSCRGTDRTGQDLAEKAMQVAARLGGTLLFPLKVHFIKEDLEILN